MRLIDADKLKEIIENKIDRCDINRDCCNCCYTGCIEKLDYDDIEEIINEQRTVERPKGKLKKITPSFFQCSNCKKYVYDISVYSAMNYCPDCGAEMEVEE